MINPDTAARTGIADGELLWVEPPRGKVKAKVKVMRRLHPEVEPQDTPQPNKISTA